MPVLQQSFTLKVEYPVLFCKGVFKKDSDLLKKVLLSHGTAPRKVLAVVDDNLFHSQPEVMGQLRSWLEYHEIDLNTTPEIEIIKGGEMVKNDTEGIDVFLKSMNDLGLCRHSAVFKMVTSNSWISRLFPIASKVAIVNSPPRCSLNSYKPLKMILE